jgi:hypothetical protein
MKMAASIDRPSSSLSDYVFRARSPEAVGLMDELRSTLIAAEQAKRAVEDSSLELKRRLRKVHEEKQKLAEQLEMMKEYASVGGVSFEPLVVSEALAMNPTPFRRPGTAPAVSPLPQSSTKSSSSGRKGHLRLDPLYAPDMPARPASKADERASKIFIARLPEDRRAITEFRQRQRELAKIWDNAEAYVRKVGKSLRSWELEANRKVALPMLQDGNDSDDEDNEKRRQLNRWADVEPGQIANMIAEKQQEMRRLREEEDKMNRILKTLDNQSLLMEKQAEIEASALAQPGVSGKEKLDRMKDKFYTIIRQVSKYSLFSQQSRNSLIAAAEESSTVEHSRQLSSVTESDTESVVSDVENVPSKPVATAVKAPMSRQASRVLVSSTSNDLESGGDESVSKSVELVTERRRSGENVPTRVQSNEASVDCATSASLTTSPVETKRNKSPVPENSMVDVHFSDDDDEDMYHQMSNDDEELRQRIRDLESALEASQAETQKQIRHSLSVEDKLRDSMQTLKLLFDGMNVVCSNVHAKLAASDWKNEIPALRNGLARIIKAQRSLAFFVEAPHESIERIVGSSSKNVSLTRTGSNNQSTMMDPLSVLQGLGTDIPDILDACFGFADKITSYSRDKSDDLQRSLLHAQEELQATRAFLDAEKEKNVDLLERVDDLTAELDALASSEGLGDHAAIVIDTRSLGIQVRTLTEDALRRKFEVEFMGAGNVDAEDTSPLSRSPAFDEGIVEIDYSYRPSSAQSSRSRPGSASSRPLSAVRRTASPLPSIETPGKQKKNPKKKKTKSPADPTAIAPSQPSPVPLSSPSPNTRLNGKQRPSASMQSRPPSSGTARQSSSATAHGDENSASSRKSGKDSGSSSLSREKPARKDQSPSLSNAGSRVGPARKDDSNVVGATAGHNSRVDSSSKTGTSVRGNDFGSRSDDVAPNAVQSGPTSGSSSKVAPAESSARPNGSVAANTTSQSAGDYSSTLLSHSVATTDDILGDITYTRTDSFLEARSSGSGSGSRSRSDSGSVDGRDDGHDVTSTSKTLPMFDKKPLTDQRPPIVRVASPSQRSSSSSLKDGAKASVTFSENIVEIPGRVSISSEVSPSTTPIVQDGSHRAGAASHGIFHDSDVSDSDDRSDSCISAPELRQMRREQLKELDPSQLDHHFNWETGRTQRKSPWKRILVKARSVGTLLVAAKPLTAAVSESSKSLQPSPRSLSVSPAETPSAEPSPLSAAGVQDVRATQILESYPVEVLGTLLEVMRERRASITLSDRIHKLKSNKSIHGRQRALAWVLKNIANVYLALMTTEIADIRMSDATFEIFSTRYGLRRLAEQNLIDFVVSIDHWKAQSVRVGLFVDFLRERLDSLTLKFYLTVMAKLNTVGLGFLQPSMQSHTKLMLLRTRAFEVLFVIASQWDCALSEFDVNSFLDSLPSMDVSHLKHRGRMNDIKEEVYDLDLFLSHALMLFVERELPSASKRYYVQGGHLRHNIKGVYDSCADEDGSLTVDEFRDACFRLMGMVPDNAEDVYAVIRKKSKRFTFGDFLLSLPYLLEQVDLSKSPTTTEDAFMSM